ncbi:MAG: T9SS type A sorting domain-containing protein [Tannerella sp.]|nr:T9SS type A sorting domain-containing protein [Tannerella sp.]
MRQVIIVMVCALICTYNVTGQISFGGLPPSFSYDETVDETVSVRSSSMKMTVPIDFYVNDLLAVDNWKAANQGAPLVVGRIIPVKYNMDNSGFRTTLPGGERIWRLQIKADGAYALMLYYNDFYIPEGAKLFIYDPGKNKVLGAYTHQTNPGGGLFATEFIGGDELVLEYVESETSSEKPRIDVGEIGYGYNEPALRTFCLMSNCQSEPTECEVNINCEEGGAWQNEKNGICYILVKIDNWMACCSGALLNNTAQDLKPIILTASHCALKDDNSSYAGDSDYSRWVFYFHRERLECSNDSYPNPGVKTMTGCKLLANTGTAGGSDGLLLQLNNDIPDDYNVYYNGWDRSNTPPSSGVGIHHPDADYMKISTFNKPASNYTWDAIFIADKNAHWSVSFVETPNGHGITEGGSSGSPLFNENKLVVGDLTGGASQCSSPYMMTAPNMYGKLYNHWDKYQNDSTRMDIWLDPLNTGVMQLPGRYSVERKPAPVNFKVQNLGTTVKVSWEAPNVSDKPVSYKLYRNNVKIFDTNTFTYVDNDPAVGTLMYSICAVYSDGEESLFTYAGISYFRYNAPTDLKAERPNATSTEVHLSWKAPLYEQTIFWGTMDLSWIVSLEDKTPFYFGQYWYKEEISILNGRTISALRFAPISGTSYEIFIKQIDGQSYRQVVNPDDVFFNVINTVYLTTPFVIDGSKGLFVAVHAYEIGDRYPAGCDDGPVVSGKGNLASWDGEEWFRVEDEGGESVNFAVAAVISSLKGDNNLLSAKAGDDEMILSRRNLDGMKKSAFVASQTYGGGISTRADGEVETSASSLPTAFPDETQYRIYRQNTKLKDVDASQTSYMDRTSNSEYFYHVTALYGEAESSKSNQAKITISAAENIDASVDLFPSSFSNFIKLKGYERVVRIEAISVTGQVCLALYRPDDTIDVSSLPPGMYFFRIYLNNNVVKVVKAIKTT